MRAHGARFLLSSSAGLAIVLLLAAAASAQPVPRPFPRPTDPQPPAPEAPPQAGTPAPEAPPPAEPQAPSGEPAPTEAMLGLPIYPTADFLKSYDAGRGQRFYLFGTNLSFSEAVAYYRTVLRSRGDLIFEQPATYMFEVGRFREETMAFPPGVTIKDYTWNGSEGYLHVTPGGQQARYRTIIQLVPAPR